MEYTHVRCLEDVSDDLGIYNIEGKIYEIYSIDEEEGLAIVECEHVDGAFEIQISLNDNAFSFLIMGE